MTRSQSDAPASLPAPYSRDHDRRVAGACMTVAVLGVRSAQIGRRLLRRAFVPMELGLGQFYLNGVRLQQLELGTSPEVVARRVFEVVAPTLQRRAQIADAFAITYDTPTGVWHGWLPADLAPTDQERVRVAAAFGLVRLDLGQAGTVSAA